MLIEQQIAERRERAAAKPPRILKRPTGGPYGDYTIQSASGRAYRVAIRGLGRFENYFDIPRSSSQAVNRVDSALLRSFYCCH